MALLPLIQFNSFRDPKGYRLSEPKGAEPRRVVRNGNRNDNFVVSEPLKNEALLYEFANAAATPEGLLKFVRSYGPTTDQGNDQGDEVDYVTYQARQMQTCLKLMSARRRKLGKIETFGVPLIVVHAAIDWDRATNSPRWTLRPSTLLDGLWLQFGQAVTRGAHIQVCAHCGEWFEVGHGSGRRLDSKFCSDEHRVQYNSLKRSKGE